MFSEHLMEEVVERHNMHAALKQSAPMGSVLG